MLKIILAITGLTVLAATPAQATTAWGQGFVDGGKPVEMFLSIDEREQLLIYGLGPTLQDLGIRNAVIPDPQVSLFRINADGERVRMETNNNWMNGNSAAAVSAALADLGVEFDPKEAAFVKQLNPGRYVVKVFTTNADIKGFAAAGATSWNGDFDPDDGDNPPPVGDIASGLWIGIDEPVYDVCFNVSEDGSALTQIGSQCRSPFSGDAESLRIKYVRLEGPCDEYLDGFDLDHNIPIVNSSFRVSVDLDNLPLLPPISVEVAGTFRNGVLEGTVSQSFGSGNDCVGEFTAMPQ